jgi:dephospho-CoA kinase
MTYKIGLTGGIGSGKSAATQFFSELGVPIIDADQLSRELVSPGHEALTKIIERFGSHFILSNGELNRQALRELVFNDPKQKQWLEQLLHPLIYQAITQQLNQIEDKYCIVVIPLLAENFEKYQSLLDHVIVIDANENQQLTRASSRDKSNHIDIQKILQSQSSRQRRLSIADTVINNDGSLEDLKNKIINLHQSILKTLS